MNEAELLSQSLGISLRATRSDLELLRSASTAFLAYVDLSPIDISQTADVDQPIDIHVRYEFPAIVQASRYTIMSPPETVTLLLDRLVTTEKTVLVESAGDVMPGFTTQASSIWPESVLVSGPESIVEGIQSLQINIDLTQADSDISQFYYIQVMGEDGTDITSRVRLSSPNVLAQISITPYGEADILPPQVLGQADEGFVFAGIGLNTDIITVVGDEAQIRSLQASGLQLGPVNIEGRNASYTVRRDLQSYLEGTGLSIRNLTPNNVEITIGIEPIVVIELEIPSDTIIIETSQASQNAVNMEFSQTSIIVAISAPYSMADQLTPEHIIVTADPSQEYQGTLPLNVSLPPGAQLISIPYAALSSEAATPAAEPSL